MLRGGASECGGLAKLAIPLLNPVIRPFAAKWHRLSLAGALRYAAHRREFRAELAALQPHLREYARVLAAMAQVEGLTALEKT